MDIMLAERRDNNKINTAQSRINNILLSLPKSITELVISEELYGEVDFSILSVQKFTNIKSIVLSPGKVTEIKGIPSTLVKLYCSGNILIGLGILPHSLKELDCSKNHITVLDLETVPNLTYLNCAYNKLHELKNLPEFLLKLICNNNSISILDLHSCQSITMVDISENYSGLIIRSRPSSLIDLKMDNGISAEIQHVANNNNINGGGSGEADHDDSMRDVTECMKVYFHMKDVYETEVKKNRRATYNNAITKGFTKNRAKKQAIATTIRCINCRASGGTIFKKKDNKYIALCGNVEKPCNLNIKIFSGIFYDFEEILHEYRIEIEKSKQHIILQKMDTLFNYVSESNSAELFKSAMEKYNAKIEITKDLTDKYNELYNNKHKQELILRKTETIYEVMDRIKVIMEEYKKTHNRELIKNAIDIQIRDLIPEISFLRQLKYEVMEVDTLDSGDSVLFQRDVKISNMVFSFDEPPKVIRFVRKNR